MYHAEREREREREIQTPSQTKTCVFACSDRELKL